MKLSKIAEHIGAVLPDGCGDVEVTGISSPEQASADKVTFISDAKYTDKAKDTAACAVIVKKGSAIAEKFCLEVDDPYVGYALVAQLFEDVSPLFGAGIHPQAIVDPSASVDKSASIGPGTIVGPGVKIGANCRIGANCVIERGVDMGESARVDSGAIIRYDTVIGSRTVIQSGAVIGSDGFGNARDKAGKYIRIPCFSNVIIGADVNIGACTTIDRGNIEPTVIGNGVKVDNLVQIAHNVTIGDDTAVVAQAGISGSTHIGKRVIIAGQAGLVGHLEVGDDSFIGAQAGLTKDIESGSKVTGSPAREFMTMRRIDAACNNLPDMQREVKALRAEVDALKGNK